MKYTVHMIWMQRLNFSLRLIMEWWEERLPGRQCEGEEEWKRKDSVIWQEERERFIAVSDNNVCCLLQCSLQMCLQELKIWAKSGGSVAGFERFFLRVFLSVSILTFIECISLFSPMWHIHTHKCICFTAVPFHITVCLLQEVCERGVMIDEFCSEM